jgi:putative ABC transport system ATP-binding protein
MKQQTLRVADVEKIYGSIRGAHTKALDGLTFSVEKGETVAIMGPSGSGKTTLLNCIATIDRPTRGTIFVGDEEVTSLKPRELADFRRNQLGFIFQDSNLLDTLTCYDNIALPLTIARVPSNEIDARVRRIAHVLGVSEVLGKYPYQVSGGQAQRVAAARALVSEPTLVLADEPTGALDSKNARILLECFEGVNERLGATILMVTHDSFAASYTNRVLFIRDGRLFCELVRGDDDRRRFFDRIMDVVATLGGSDSAPEV